MKSIFHHAWFIFYEIVLPLIGVGFVVWVVCLFARMMNGL